VFLGFAPSIVGWALLEITSRSLFALNRPWLPMCAAAIPVGFNLVFSAVMRANGLTQPEFVGLGASCGLLLAFVVLLGLAHGLRKRFDAEPLAGEPSQELVGAG
jgi:peptidoglycan biosynthesis protein MviN/MurJ (putative lipid II flippase)